MDLFLGLCEGLLTDIFIKHNFSQYQDDPPSKAITEQPVFWLELQEALRCKHAKEVTTEQLYEIRSLVAKSAYRMPNVYLENPVYRRDVLFYAENKQLPYPVWTTAGTVTWGMQHIMSNIEKSDGILRREHWSGMCIWGGIDTAQPILDQLHELEILIKQSTVIKRGHEDDCDVYYLKSPYTRPDKKETPLQLHCVPDTGLLVTGWIGNEKKHHNKQK